jgi:hypothetical protein
MDSTLESAARRGYFAGLGFTLLVAVAGQVFLGRLPEGQGTLDAVREFGYSFTGLCLLGGYLLARRARGFPARIRGRESARRARLIWREYLAVAGACAASAAFGVLYWGLGGRPVERHARTFVALGPAAFLVLAPRPGRLAPPDSA